MHGTPCTWGRDCASANCTCENPSAATHDCGVCTKPKPMVYYAVSLGSGKPVGITTRGGSTSEVPLASLPLASLPAIQHRVATAAATMSHHESRFGANLSEVTRAVGAAIAWRHIFVPAEVPINTMYHPISALTYREVPLYIRTYTRPFSATSQAYEYLHTTYLLYQTSPGPTSTPTLQIPTLTPPLPPLYPPLTPPLPYPPPSLTPPLSPPYPPLTPPLTVRSVRCCL
jgi:hypothetical protein